MSTKVHYNAVFLSDLHLGASASSADAATDFLKSVDCKTLYLVGDIIDLWRLRARWYWPESHNRFIRRLLKMSKRGTRIIFLPGNHDEHARPYAGLNFGGIEIALQHIHTAADGKRYLITHGDEADLVIRHARLLSVIGSKAYDLLVVLNRWLNRGLATLGRRPWSLSKAIKSKVKSACQYVARFEEALVESARLRGLDGVVCGHIHKPEIRTMNCGTVYINCGDWVESLTAVVEHDDGTMRVIDCSARALTPATEHHADDADLDAEAAISTLPIPLSR